MFCFAALSSAIRLPHASKRLSDHRGEPHKILVHVIRENDDCRIADISYDSGKSLIDHYRATTRR